MLVRSKRVLRGAVVSTGLLVTAVACEVPPPLPTFTVNTTTDGTDADPGDGICEMTVGAGDCSLRAAIDEGNAGTGATLVLPTDADFDLIVADAGDGDIDLDVTSAITVEPVEPMSRIVSNSGAVVVDVAEGGSLTGSGLGIQSARVAGGLALDSSVVGPGYASGTVLDVAATGNAVISTTSIASSGGASTVVNAGSLVAMHTSIRGLSSGTLVTTSGAGTTRLAGTRLLRATVLTSGFYPIVGAPYCSGNAIASEGYNFSPTTDCNLTATGDIAGVSYGTGPNPLGTPTLFGPTPPDSPVRGAIPEGVLACGDEVPATAGACDIGWG